MLSDHQSILASCFALADSQLGMMLLVTPDKMLARGLELIGFDEHCQRHVGPATNADWFWKSSGSTPVIYLLLLEDLQTTAIPEAYVAKPNLDYFLHAIHFLKCYQSERTIRNVWSQ